MKNNSYKKTETSSLKIQDQGLVLSETNNISKKILKSILNVKQNSVSNLEKTLVSYSNELKDVKLEESSGIKLSLIDYIVNQGIGGAYIDMSKVTNILLENGVQFNYKNKELLEELISNCRLISVKDTLFSKLDFCFKLVDYYSILKQDDKKFWDYLIDSIECNIRKLSKSDAINLSVDFLKEKKNEKLPLSVKNSHTKLPSYLLRIHNFINTLRGFDDTNNVTKNYIIKNKVWEFVQSEEIFSKFTINLFDDNESSHGSFFHEVCRSRNMNLLIESLKIINKENKENKYSVLKFKDNQSKTAFDTTVYHGWDNAIEKLLPIYKNLKIDIDFDKNLSSTIENGYTKSVEILAKKGNITEKHLKKAIEHRQETIFKFLLKKTKQDNNFMNSILEYTISKKDSIIAEYLVKDIGFKVSADNIVLAAKNGGEKMLGILLKASPTPKKRATEAIKNIIDGKDCNPSHEIMQLFNNHSKYLKLSNRYTKKFMDLLTTSKRNNPLTKVNRFSKESLTSKKKETTVQLS